MDNVDDDDDEGRAMVEIDSIEPCEFSWGFNNLLGKSIRSILSKMTSYPKVRKCETNNWCIG